MKIAWQVEFGVDVGDDNLFETETPDVGLEDNAVEQLIYRWIQEEFEQADSWYITVQRTEP